MKRDLRLCKLVFIANDEAIMVAEVGGPEIRKRIDEMGEKKGSSYWPKDASIYLLPLT